MKKLVKVIIFVAMMVMATLVSASNVIVIDVAGKGQVRNEVQEALICTFVNAGFEVVERQQLNHVLRELNLHQSGLIDSNTAVAMGEMTGAQFTLVGNITSGGVINFQGFGYRGRKAKLRMSYKLIDNRTGRIVKANVVTSSSSMMQDRRYSSSANDRILLSRAASELSEKVLVSFSGKKVK